MPGLGGGLVSCFCWLLAFGGVGVSGRGVWPEDEERGRWTRHTWLARASREQHGHVRTGHVARCGTDRSVRILPIVVVVVANAGDVHPQQTHQPVLGRAVVEVPYHLREGLQCRRRVIDEIRHVVKKPAEYRSAVLGWHGCGQGEGGGCDEHGEEFAERKPHRDCRRGRLVQQCP